jgi:hypothetical protein
VQPTLEGGSGRCRHLQLLAFYPDDPQVGHIEGGVLREFLHEFYRALSVDEPEQDADFRAMDRWLTKAVSLMTL